LPDPQPLALDASSSWFGRLAIASALTAICNVYEAPWPPKLCLEVTGTEISLSHCFAYEITFGFVLPILKNAQL
jgi:hypothetical protein